MTVKIERVNTAAMFLVEYTEELLEQHQTELRKLREFYSANKNIFGKVEEHNTLWKQFLSMEVS